MTRWLNVHSLKYKYLSLRRLFPSSQPHDHPTRLQHLGTLQSNEREKSLHIIKMQLITFLSLSLATLGAHAAGGIPARLVRKQALELNPRAEGVRRHPLYPQAQTSKLTVEKVCGIDYLCHVSGTKKQCQIGAVCS